jgi:serine/threonine-protein kinase
LEKLGEGRFGRVYKVQDIHTGQIYALKVSKDPLYTDLLMKEAQSVLLFNHPNLVKLYSYFLSRDKKRIYLLYEYADGGDLKNFVIQRGGKLKLPEAVSILKQIARGLDYLHTKGYIHFDIKPENVLSKFSNQSRIWKLGDFGLLKTRGYSGILDIKGTVGFIAPEVFHGEIHRSSDIFSLGCLFYYMLEGHHPFKASNPAEELAKNRRGIVETPKGLEGKIKEIFLKMVNPDPLQRYRTAGQLLKDLETLEA